MLIDRSMLRNSHSDGMTMGVYALRSFYGCQLPQNIVEAKSSPNGRYNNTVRRKIRHIMEWVGTLSGCPDCRPCPR